MTLDAEADTAILPGIKSEGRVTMEKASKWRTLLTPAFLLQAAAVFVLGSLVGVSLFTLIYAKGYSYLGSDPRACVNCHVMEPQYAAWKAGSHAGVATCNDCHTPHDNIVHKYLVKAEHGINHGAKFTTGWYPEHIQIRESSRKVTNEACLYCHSDLTSDMHVTYGSDQIQCTHCHSGVGHESR